MISHCGLDLPFLRDLRYWAFFIDLSFIFHWEVYSGLPSFYQYATFFKIYLINILPFSSRDKILASDTDSFTESMSGVTCGGRLIGTLPCHRGHQLVPQKMSTCFSPCIWQPVQLTHWTVAQSKNLHSWARMPLSMESSRVWSLASRQILVKPHGQ